MYCNENRGIDGKSQETKVYEKSEYSSFLPKKVYCIVERKYFAVHFFFGVKFFP